MATARSNTLVGAKQLTFYFIFGVAQLGMDWAVFVALTFAGIPVPIANVLSRTAAAVAGYLLNGSVTFRSASRSRLSQKALARYLLLWAMLTAISTISIHMIESHSDVATTRLTKPIVEGLLAIVSFVTMKFWVYR